MTQSCVGLTKELQFLRQVQYLRVDQLVGDQRFQEYRTRLPFKFTIPNQLISVCSEVHPDFLKPCPSTNIDRSFENATCFIHAYQPWITYHIKISRVRADGLIPSTFSSQAREIPIVPFSYAAPPVEVTHHPQQYQCSSTKALKQSIFSRLQGHLTLSAVEPAPINLLTEAPRASTTASLKLSFSPANQTRVDLGRWRLIVKSHLRVRTFTTIHKLSQAPTSVTCHTDPFLHTEEQNEKWEVRECGPVAWIREQQAGDYGVSKTLWTAELRVPVSVSKKLLPTFLNLLSARQYALVLRVSIAELWNWSGLEVAIPLQLICHGQGKLMEEDNFELEGQNDSGCVFSEQCLPPSYRLL